MNDPLDGFRPEHFDEDQRTLLRALRHPELDLDLTREQLEVARAAREFLNTPLGRYIEQQADDAEQRYLNVSQQIHDPRSDEFFREWIDYQTAMRGLLWMGTAVAVGAEAQAEYESNLEAEQPPDDITEPNYHEGQP